MKGWRLPHQWQFIATGARCWWNEMWKPCQEAAVGRVLKCTLHQNKRLRSRLMPKNSLQWSRKEISVQGDKVEELKAFWRIWPSSLLFKPLIIHVTSSALLNQQPTIYCIERQLFAENRRSLLVCQFPWSPEDPIQFAKSCTKLFQTRINSIPLFDLLNPVQEDLVGEGLQVLLI